MVEKDLYREIFENLPTATIITDSKGTILKTTPSAIKLLGYRKKDLISSNIKNLFFIKLVDLNDKNQRPVSIKEILNTLKITKEILVQKKKGEVFSAEIKLSSFRIGVNKFFTWTVRELHHEKKIIADLKERVKEQLALLQVTETLFNCSDVNIALSKCVSHIRDGWQFPEYTVVRIKLNDGSGYKTEGFVETNWGLISTIGNHGTIEVFYTTEVPVSGESIFLQEEKKLIDGLAKLLGIFLDQLNAATKLQEKEALIRRITNQIPANTYQFEIDQNGNLNILFASKGINEYLFDYNAEELVKDPK
jgi:PAS domain S-box-containing protein